MRVNNHVLILREAITKIVPMLTQRSVKVTQQGTRAYVAYSRKTHEIERVNLPYIPDDADDNLLAATQGFLDHEVGHILFTDQKAVVKAEKLGIHWLHNLVEDTFVERKMGERFPGSGDHLSRMHGFFLREYIDSQIKEAPEQAKQILMVPAFRALAGQPAFIDYMADKWDQISDVVDKLGKDFPKMLKSIETSWDALKVAEEAKKRLSKPTPKPKAPPAPKPPAPPPSAPEPEDDSSEPPEPGMPGDEDQDEPPTAGDPSSGVEPSPEADPTEGDEPPPADESDSEHAPESEGEDVRDEPAPEGENVQDDADAGGGDDDADDSVELGDGMPGGDAAQGDESAESGDEGDGDSQDEDDEGSTGASGAEGDEGEEGEGVTPGGGAPEENDEPTKSLFDELSESPPADFDEAAAEALSKNARDATKGSQYSLFSRDFDDVSMLEVEEGFNQDHVTAMQKEVDHMIGPLQKSLERAVAARSASVWTGGHKSGRLHGPSLARISVGRADVFRRKQVNKTKDVAVELLVDCSGSMWSKRKMVIAAYSAYALSSVLDQLGISNEVLAFTTKDFPREALQQMMKEEEEGGFVYSRRTALRLAIVKGFNERMTPDVRRRFAQLAHCYEIMQENVDGESVQIAARRLMQQRSERKILKVLSDGMPACHGTSKTLEDHLKEVVRQVEGSGIDVIGLGILTDAVKAFYRSHVVLNDVKELPTTVMKELHRLLLK